MKFIAATVMFAMACAFAAWMFDHAHIVGWGIFIVVVGAFLAAYIVDAK